MLPVSLRGIGHIVPIEARDDFLSSGAAKFPDLTHTGSGIMQYFSVQKLHPVLGNAVNRVFCDDAAAIQTQKSIPQHLLQAVDGGIGLVVLVPHEMNHRLSSPQINIEDRGGIDSNRHTIGDDGNGLCFHGKSPLQIECLTVFINQKLS